MRGWGSPGGCHGNGGRKAAACTGGRGDLQPPPGRPRSPPPREPPSLLRASLVSSESLLRHPLLPKRPHGSPLKSLDSLLKSPQSLPSDLPSGIPGGSPSKSSQSLPSDSPQSLSTDFPHTDPLKIPSDLPAIFHQPLRAPPPSPLQPLSSFSDFLRGSTEFCQTLAELPQPSPNPSRNPWKPGSSQPLFLGDLKAPA